jgi:hypothetical protein
MIEIGKSIFAILSGNTIVKNYVVAKIYPLVIPEFTLLPCIVYERQSDLEYTRDGGATSTSVIDVTVLSEDYTETINISVAVYNALNNYKGIAAGINIKDIRLTSCSETYAESAFIQRLTFSCWATL